MEWSPHNDWDGYRRLAAAVVTTAVDDVLRKGPGSGDSKREWLRNRDRALRWIKDPKRSMIWCDMAGIEWEDLVDRLEDRLARKGVNIRKDNRSGTKRNRKPSIRGDE